MNRIFELQRSLLREIDKQDKIEIKRDQPLDWERIHLASCARLGYLMAEARGVDPVLAACACSIHDYGRILTGKQEGHAEEGYLPGRRFLEETGLFNDEEVELLARAIRNHSKKSEIGTPVEEIVKDADVIDFYQYGLGFAREEQKIRYENMLRKDACFRLSPLK